MRVVLVEDNCHMREIWAGLCQYDSAGQIEVVGQAADGIEALASIGATEPDCVVLDLEMPRMHGLEVITRVRQIGGLAL